MSSQLFFGWISAPDLSVDAKQVKPMRSAQGRQYPMKVKAKRKSPAKPPNPGGRKRFEIEPQAIMDMVLAGHSIKQSAAEMGYAIKTITRVLKESGRLEEAKAHTITRSGVTIEAILALQSQGKNEREIARILNCSRTTVGERITRHRLADKAAADALRTCHLCGGSKWPRSPVCAYCKKLGNGYVKKER